MKRKRLLALILFLAVPAALAGCVSMPESASGGRGRTASRGRLTIGRGKSADQARANGRDQRGIDDFSPEGSMERDLQALREREKIQERKIQELQGGLDQRNDLVRREQETLDEIRQRIDSYDTAIQRYEMAAQSRPPREIAGEPAVVPAEMFEDRAAGATPARYHSDDSLPGSPFASPGRTTRTLYSAPAEPAYTDLPVREYRSAPPQSAAADDAYASEYETVIYAPQPAAEPAPRDNAIVITAPGNGVPKPRKTAARDAGRAAGGETAAGGWEAPESLFAKTATPSVPAYPPADSGAESALDQAVRAQAAATAAAPRPRVSAMTAPAAAKTPKSLPKTEFRRPEEPAARVAAPPAEAAPSLDDDVFTPDLFLSGG